MSVTLIHPQSGMKQTVPTGFSWTSLFFGALVPLFRGDLTTAGLVLFVCVISAGVAVPFCWLYLACCYNGQFLKAQVEKGWTFTLSEQSLRGLGL